MAGVALLLAGCGNAGETASVGVPGGAKTIYLTAMEFKGSTEVSKEPFPATKLPEGSGYGLKAPSGDPAKWEVNAYAWSPASFVVVENDEVTLQIVGVNGAKHVTTIEGHGDQFTVTRGVVTSVKFNAGKPGVYKVECLTHAPNMTGQLIVLPAAK